KPSALLRLMIKRVYSEVVELLVGDACDTRYYHEENRVKWANPHVRLYLWITLLYTRFCLKLSLLASNGEAIVNGHLFKYKATELLLYAARQTCYSLG
ncbi:hypothetical protein, partial [Vibrio sp. M260118]|uniref:hypothetical protein n=1 Tax=Vibrio sp. M260118 TaxID=3020896 RepID=UPI002F423BB5